MSLDSTGSPNETPITMTTRSTTMTITIPFFSTGVPWQDIGCRRRGTRLDDWLTSTSTITRMNDDGFPR
ncbi:predicted protein [Lichtheimia corymbifera JMRC:FSU:9682]|uniref:Uncharacterized protein n=1 Tax=Lichtheimia corymbifera JMRC:FSU:9682 TaxID=1263082 RepID=A0A068SBP6_9FUNG|nr:predicted protein [Lichtheimia corymbifera JMRC:FSU:9682]